MDYWRGPSFRKYSVPRETLAKNASSSQHPVGPDGTPDPVSGTPRASLSGFPGSRVISGSVRPDSICGSEVQGRRLCRRPKTLRFPRVDGTDYRPLKKKSRSTRCVPSICVRGIGVRTHVRARVCVCVCVGSHLSDYMW